MVLGKLLACNFVSEIT